MTLGLGGSTVGIMAMANLSLESGSLLLSARMGVTGSLELTVPDTESKPSKIDIADYSVLAGRTWLRHGTRFFVEAGPGIAKITRRGDHVLPGPGETFPPYYKMSSDKVVNLAFQAGAREDWSIVGVGLAVVGNLNNGASELGLALTVSLGKMRD